MLDDESEDSASEFSASEEEWKPHDRHGGESSDDDDSDFEEEPVAANVGKSKIGLSTSRKRDPKDGDSSKTSTSGLAKKRKQSQSLRTKLYNKYRPPPKTLNSGGSNSPSASTSQTATKNAKAPNESSEHCNSSSESSVEDYLVDPSKLDLRSSFFDVASIKSKELSPIPNFDCNAGFQNLSDSESEDNESSDDDHSNSKAFDFHNLLQKAHSLEHAMGKVSEKNLTTVTQENLSTQNVTDISSLLALGENLNEGNENNSNPAPLRLNKTKSTRVKRHTKTRPTSTVVGGDSDDTDLDEVPDEDDSVSDDNNLKFPNEIGDLEIVVELPSKRKKEMKKQQDLELAIKRKINRDLKERQLLLHKASVLCCLARSYLYNRLANETNLMNSSLKLLPSKNSYPPERGTEIKYFQSLVTWFKTVIKLKSQNFYPEKLVKTKKLIKKSLLKQIEQKEATCKQDMILIFVILMRAMGLACRLVVNLQPIPLRPSQGDLIKIQLKPNNDKNDDGNLDRANDKSKVTSRFPKSSNKTKDESKTKSQNNNKKKNIEEKTGKETSLTKKSQSKDSDQKHIHSPTKDNSKSTSRNNTNFEIAIKKMYKSIDMKENEYECKGSKDNSVCTIPSKTSQKRVSLPSETDGEPIKKTTCRTHMGKLKNIKSEVPKIVIEKNSVSPKEGVIEMPSKRDTRSQGHSQSPKIHVSPSFLKNSCAVNIKTPENTSSKLKCSKKKIELVKISPEFLKTTVPKRVLRPRQKSKESTDLQTIMSVPQLDGADDTVKIPKIAKNKRPKLNKLKTTAINESDEDFEPSPPKKPKPAPILPKSVQELRKDRRVLSTDDEDVAKKDIKEKYSADMWIEVWSDVEELWTCIDLFKGKVHSVESIRKSASNLVYVFALQNDLSIKDVSARYCPNWATTLRKSRVDNTWLTAAICNYFGQRTKRDLLEDQELRRIHEDKPMPTTIGEYKDHPLYALERHLLKFQAIYPPDAPTLGFVRGEPVYSRDCVHTLHSRDIWLKQARTVKLGEQPYKIVKARPKWDRINQTVIKDQPLEIFGYWQTQDYEPETAKDGIVPRNCYGNVELFKECMLPKKTVHLRLPGLNRICKKLGIDCASAVIGFDFHQGSCHPICNGFVVCEEFADQVTAAWYQDQEEQDRKEQEKYETRVYGNWKKLIRGLLIRERLKKKYNF